MKLFQTVWFWLRTPFTKVVHWSYEHFNCCSYFLKVISLLLWTMLERAPERSLISKWICRDINVNLKLKFTALRWWNYQYLFWRSQTNIEKRKSKYFTFFTFNSDLRKFLKAYLRENCSSKNVTDEMATSPAFSDFSQFSNDCQRGISRLEIFDE